MKVIHWNISWGSHKEKILEHIMEVIDCTGTIVCLQEVLPSVESFIRTELCAVGYKFIYSLDYRVPGKYDSRTRKLGVLIIISPDIELEEGGVLMRTPFPDRTAYVVFRYWGETYKLVSLHSVAGVNFKRGKSVQFDSFAEAIEDIQPDLVTVDANEPKVDHYEVKQMEFFDNLDKGAGARHFFTALVSSGLADAYALVYDKRDYVPGEPLTTSHIVARGGPRRYDFIFVNDKRFHLKGCEYHYQDALIASSDHAYIVAELL